MYPIKIWTVVKMLNLWDRVNQDQEGGLDRTMNGIGVFFSLFLFPLLKNPAKRRSALNLHLCIDYYIQNHLNTHLNTHHNTSRNTHLYTGLYWVGVRWAMTKCWWRLLASHGRLRLGWAVTIKPKYWVGVG